MMPVASPGSTSRSPRRWSRSPRAELAFAAAVPHLLAAPSESAQAPPPRIDPMFRQTFRQAFRTQTSRGQAFRDQMFRRFGIDLEDDASVRREEARVRREFWPKFARFA